MPESHVPTVVMSDLADWQKTAIEAFVSQCTLPSLYDEESHLDQIGTGTLIEIEERLFLITADHLLEGRDPARFSIPMPPAKIPWTLGGCNLLRPKMQTGDIDVVIFELLEAKTIWEAKISWKILSLDHIGEASQNGVFVLCGYPTAVAKVHRG